MHVYYAVVVLLLISPFIIGWMIFLELSQTNQDTEKFATENATSEKTGGELSPADRIFDVPPPNASQEEKELYGQLLLQHAVQSEKIVLTSCNPDPFVTTLPADGSITIENPEDIDHTIIINPEEQFVIPKNSQKVVTIQFPPGINILGYGCDGTGKGVGFFVKEPEK